jgi:hypothetical protein
MSKYSAPEISRGSPIYRMAKNRNYKVFFTSLAIFIFGILTLYDGLVRPVAQTSATIVLDFIIIVLALYGFYLFLIRSLDIFRHPDVNKFLSFKDPRHYIEIFEKEATDGSRKKFGDGFLTRNFLVSETFYRFRWACATEITAAYIEKSRVYYRGKISIPFIGLNTVIVRLDGGGGATLHINCDTKGEAESLLKMLADIAPSARFGSAIYEKPDKPEEYDAVVQYVSDTIRQIPGYVLPETQKYEPTVVSKAYASDLKNTAPGTASKSVSMIRKKIIETPAVTSAPVVRAEPARVRELSKDEIFSGQIKNLYDSLENGDIGQSVTAPDAMGDSMNFAAVDILEILLEYVDEPVRVHAAFALGKLCQKSSLEPLIRALDDPSVQVRENAAIALGKIGDRRAVAPLQQVSTEDVRVKKAAVSALARIDQKLGIYNKQGNGSSSTFTALDLGRHASE